MEVKGLNRETKNRISYVNFIIMGFARAFYRPVPEVYQYLEKFGGMKFLLDNYDYEHTQSEHNTIMTLLKVCRRNGGWL
jgi:hypothetical protein